MLLRPLLILALAITAFVATRSSAEPAIEPVEEARKLRAKGVAFLRQQQLPDGTWQPVEQVPPAITALALRGMMGANDPADAEAIERGFEALVAQQVDNGGIYDDLLANYNTAISVSALAYRRDQIGDGKYDAELDRALAYLRRLQWTPDTREDFAEEEVSQTVSGESDPFFGGWGYGGRSRGAGRPDLSNAQMALEALHEAGVPKDDPAYQRALTFVSRLQNNSETNVGSWAGDDGGFIYGPDADRSFESMAGEYATPDGRRRLRSYGSMTYAGLKSMIYAGLDRDDPRVVAAYDWIRENWTLDENPGMAEGDPEKADYGLYYYYLTLARALDVYDEPTLDTPFGEVDWRVEFIEKAKELQRDDGSWAGEAKWRENDPTMVTAYMTIALDAVLNDLEEHPPEPGT